jgi:hypothetical protein
MIKKLHETFLTAWVDGGVWWNGQRRGKRRRRFVVEQHEP